MEIQKRPYTTSHFILILKKEKEDTLKINLKIKRISETAQG